MQKALKFIAFEINGMFTNIASADVLQKVLDSSMELLKTEKCNTGSRKSKIIQILLK